MARTGKIVGQVGQIGGKPEARELVTEKGSPQSVESVAKVENVELVEKVEVVEYPGTSVHYSTTPTAAVAAEAPSAPEQSRVILDEARFMDPKDVANVRVQQLSLGDSALIQIQGEGVKPSGPEAASSEEEKIRKTWGTVMTFTKFVLRKGDAFPMPLAHDQSIEMWVPHENVFSSMNEAERHIKDSVESGALAAGRYVIARKVKGLRCTVEQIRRVDTVEED